MRLAIVTESFLPQVNGVTNSVLRMCEYLRAHGHDVMVVAPGPGDTAWQGTPVLRVPSAPVPGYGSHRVAVPWIGLTSALREFAPDIVHLASPAVLGAQAVITAEALGVPTVAVYQTDLPAFLTRYHAPITTRAMWRWLRWIHERAALTLAPSTHAVAELRRHGVPRVQLWARGVDHVMFNPGRRDDRLRADLAPHGQKLVGYVGRLAPEKNVDLLREVCELRQVQLVIVGDGPARPALERALPGARFLGQRSGADLATIFASLDIFVHTGEHETFCQAAQEALASGVPVVAPAAGGLLDLVTHRTTGLLYEPGSELGLRTAVQALLQDDVLRAELAGRAAPSVAARSWERIGDEYLRWCAPLLPVLGSGAAA